METLMALVVLPVMLLNFAGGIAGGIWLIVIGKWALVLILVITSLIGTWILGLLLSPTLLLIPLLKGAMDKKRYLLAYLIGIASSVWVYILMTLWCVPNFLWVLSQNDTGTIWPYLLSAYAIATGPWTYMASQEARAGGGDSSAMSSFFVCLGTLVMMVLALLGFESGALFWGFVVTMFIAWVLQILMVIDAIRKERMIAAFAEIGAIANKANEERESE